MSGMYEHLERAKSLAKSEFGLIYGSFLRNHEIFGDRWAVEFNELLGGAFPDESSLRQVLQGYTEFAVNSMRLQVAFQRDRRYVEKTYEQATEETYANEEQMMNEYLPGILISHFLWVHHYRQKVFFKEIFLREMAQAQDLRFHDVGIGTGFYSQMVLSALPEAQGVGYDLSPHSIAYTKHLLSQFQVFDRYALKQENILETEIEPRPFLLSVEVLEHLEDPLSFLRGLHRMLTKGGKAFITAALTAPHRDHIYLYNNEQEVLDQVREAGFHVEAVLGAYAYSPTKHLPLVPSVIALMASK